MFKKLVYICIVLHSTTLFSQYKISDGENFSIKYGSGTTLIYSDIYLHEIKNNNSIKIVTPNFLKI